MKKELKQLKISVIIPIYNAQSYLDRCIQSLLAQTIKEFEIILVDDGSIDKSNIICDNYAIRYENVKVIHQKNSGIVSARETGLKEASGKYISFVDADDWVEEDFLEVHFLEMERTDADIVMSGCVHEIGDKAECIQNNIEPGFYDSSQKAKLYSKMLYYGGFFQFGIQPYVWNKLYKRELLIQTIGMIDEKITDGEDAARVFPYLLLANKFVILSDCKYHYVYRDKSMSHSNKDLFYMENTSRLYLSLKNNMEKTLYWKILQPQLDRYMCMMVWKGNIEFFKTGNKVVFPFDRVKKNARVALYGAGFIGSTYYEQVSRINYAEVVIWVDRRNDNELKRLGVRAIPDLKNVEFDVVVIAVENKDVCNQIREMLVDAYNIPVDKILF